MLSKQQHLRAFLFMIAKWVVCRGMYDMAILNTSILTIKIKSNYEQENFYSIRGKLIIKLCVW